ncbi:MAG: EAL domain-containing protein, partial [Wujia sp.]
LQFMNMKHCLLYDMTKEVDSQGKSYFYLTDMGFLYMYHRLCISIFATVILILLYVSIKKGARIYATQYKVLLCLTIISVTANIMYGWLDWKYDYSAITYGVIAIAVYYYGFKYTPKGLVEQMLGIAVHHMEDGVLCFDNTGRCIYANEYATQIFGGNKEERYLEKIYKDWLDGRDPSSLTEHSWHDSAEIDGEKHTYSAVYRQIFDDEGLWIGCYFVMHDETESDRQIEEEQYRIRYDILTGLYTKDYFYVQVEKLLKENPNESYCIMCADIENFKMINDVFGIEKGDAVIKKCAEIIQKYATGDTVYGRLMGDRFAICLREDRLELDAYMEAISEVGSVMGNTSYKLRICLGICKITNRSTPIPVICDRALFAIESIKGNYQETIAFYDERVREQAIEEQHMIGNFRTALIGEEFQMYLQPQTSDTGEVLGAEVLTRWLRPGREMLMPAEFLPVLEHSGLISVLDQYVWERSCKLLKKWQEMKLPYYLSVNVSPRDFFLLDMYQTLTTLVECYEIEPWRLHLEIRENTVMKDSKKQLEILGRLREYGIVVIMDGFGSGYSSLNMLQDMNVDAWKIGTEFLDNEEDIERSKMILNMILNLSKDLNMSVYAGCIEKKEQYDYLKSIGCEKLQGNFIASPMSVNKFEMTYCNKE